MPNIFVETIAHYYYYYLINSFIYCGSFGHSNTWLLKKKKILLIQNFWGPIYTFKGLYFNITFTVFIQLLTAHFFFTNLLLL